MLIAVNCLQAKAPGLDLEATGAEYKSYFDANRSNKDINGPRVSDAINNILNVGARNLDWFKLINSNRPANNQLALYTPDTQTGIPIDTPKAYNEETVTTDYNNLLAGMPVAYKNVLLGTGALPTTHPFATDDEYITWARATDRVYQSASRWALMEPNLSDLAARSYEDVRGYYFLSKIADIETQLNGWGTLSTDTQKQYFPWLVSLCHNSQKDTKICTDELNSDISSNNVSSYYKTYLPSGQSVYNNFFVIQVDRADITNWNAQNPNVMGVPFLDPNDDTIKNWLSANIEDEWKWGAWNLRLNFVTVDNNTTHIRFQPGTTPHVDAVGGSEITMDQNSPLQDYGTRWTIRHEYGHTLGFPDCYIEFYDTDSKLIINYQLDLADIMCSRKGHVQQRHYDELSKHYFHN